MNRLILALIISCGLTACSNNGTKKSASTVVRLYSCRETVIGWKIGKQFLAIGMKIRIL